MIYYSYHFLYFLRIFLMNKTRLFTLMSVFALIFSISLPWLSIAQDAEDDLAELLDQLAESDTTAVETPPTDTATGADTTGEHDAANDVINSEIDSKWSYSTDESISVEDITHDSALVKTTEILYDNTPVTKYKVYVSDKKLLAVEDYSTIEDRILIPEKVENRMVYLKLDNLSPEKTYYVIVSPVHPTDPTLEAVDMISDEVSFTTKKAPVTSSTKIFTRVSYTYDAGKVKLTWAPSTLADKAEISIRRKDNNNMSYTKVWTARLDAGSFVFSVDEPGSYFLKMSAVDGQGNMVWQEHIQTIKIDEVTKQPVEKVVKEAPKVWPASDAIIGLMIFAVLVYLVYRFRAIKVKD